MEPDVAITVTQLSEADFPRDRLKRPTRRGGVQGSGVEGFRAD